jgi:hypothetical protein
MHALTLRGTMAALGSISALAGPPAAAAGPDEACYGFGDLEVGTAWLIEPKTELPIGIGASRVHPLELHGVVQTP